MSRHLAQRLLPATVAIGLFISIAVPATYYLLRSDVLHHTRFDAALHDLTTSTILLFLLSLAIGSSLAGLVYLFPVRIVRQSESQTAGLVEALENRVTRLRTLIRLNRLVSSSLDLGDVLREITTAAAQIMQSPLVAFWMIDREGRGFDLIAVSDEEIWAQFPHRWRPIDKGIIGWVARHRTIANVPDIAADDRFVTSGWFHERGLRSYFGIPVIVDDALVAVLSLNARRPFVVTEDDRSLLDTFVAQAGAAIRNARVFADSERRRRVAEAMADVGRVFSQTRDPAVVATRIVEAVKDLLGAATVGLYRLDTATGDLIGFAACGDHGTARPSDMRFPAGTGIVGLSVTSGAPVFTTDVLADPRNVLPADQRLRIERAGYKTVLGIPLSLQGKILGALGVIRKESRAFDDADIALAQTFANQAALTLDSAQLYRETERTLAELEVKNAELDDLALENARLYEEARRQQTRLTQIFDSTSDGLVLVDEGGLVGNANRQAGALLGFDPARATGQPFASLITGTAAGDTAGAVAPLLALLAGGEDTGHGMLEIGPEPRTLHWAGQATHDGATRLGFTLTFHDVTEDQRVNRMKSDFVSFVAHQLRTPLSGIKWMLELAQPLAAGTETEDYIQDAGQCADRLVRMVNDLLSLSRLENGTLKVAMEPLSLSDLTQAVLCDVKPIVEARAHHLSVTVPETDVTVDADPRLLREALLNVLSNAVKFTPDGGDLAIRMQCGDGQVVWELQDSGIGIPAQALERLGEKFYRADNAVSVDPNGTGLGLYLVRLIVRRCGGQIAWTSESGHGTTVRITLPLRAEM